MCPLIYVLNYEQYVSDFDPDYVCMYVQGWAKDWP
jgi:hypothetical protein